MSDECVETLLFVVFSKARLTQAQTRSLTAIPANTNKGVGLLRFSNTRGNIPQLQWVVSLERCGYVEII